MVPRVGGRSGANDSASDMTDSAPLGAHFASPAPESEGLRLLKKKSTLELSVSYGKPTHSTDL